MWIALAVAGSLLLLLVVLNLTSGEKKIEHEIPPLYGVSDPQFTRSMGVLLGPAIVLVVVGLVAASAWFVNAPLYNQGTRDIAELQQNPPECFGAASVLDSACAGADFGDTILPAPGFAGIDRPENPDCFVQLTDSRPVSCTFGSDDSDAPRIALIGYAAMTIAGYLVMGPYFTLGFIAKGIEAALITLLVVDIFRVYGSPMGFVRTALDSVAPVLPERFRPTAA